MPEGNILPGWQMMIFFSHFVADCVGIFIRENIVLSSNMPVESGTWKNYYNEVYT